MTALSDLIREANTLEWSTRDIAKRASDRGLKLSHATAGKVLNGTHGRINLDTVFALEAVFNIPRNRITDAAEMPRIGELYQPPIEAARLSERQRRAVTELILSIVNDQGGTAHGNAAPTKPPPDELGPRRVASTAKKAARKTTEPPES